MEELLSAPLAASHSKYHIYGLKKIAGERRGCSSLITSKNKTMTIKYTQEYVL